MFTLRKIGNNSLTFFITERLCLGELACKAFCFGEYERSTIIYSKYNHQLREYSEII